MSATGLKLAADQWLFGERFYLRSSLDEEECKRRVGLYSSGVFIPSVTSDLIAVWKGNRVYVTTQLYGRRSPWLVGRVRPTGTSTEIEGRSGGDPITFWGMVGMEAFFVWQLLSLGASLVLWSVLAAPIVGFLLLRRSPHGEHLIDFLQQLLNAENVLARTGDPIVRV